MRYSSHCQIAPLYRPEKLGQFGDSVQFGVFGAIWRNFRNCGPCSRYGAWINVCCSKIVSKMSKKEQRKLTIAEKRWIVWVRTNITYDIITLAGKDLQSQPKYSENESVQKIKFSHCFITNFMRRYGLRIG